MAATTRLKSWLERGKAKPAQPGANKTKPKNIKRIKTPGALQVGDLLERISDGFVAFDLQMNYIYVNARGGELLGRKPEDLIGKNHWVEYPEAKGTPFAVAYLRALETQQPVVFEDYYAPWERWFENRIHPSKDGLSVFFTDITERKRAEEKLPENEARLNAIIENAGGTIFSIDAQRRLTMANTEYFRSTKAALGKELRLGDEMPPTFLPPDLRAEWTERYERALRGENVLEETATPTVTGGLLHREFAINPIRDAQGRIIGAACFGRDTTERKRAEEELRLSRNRLAELSRRLVEARENEARAIGRELHDQFGQILTAMKITLDMAGRLPEEAAKKKIGQAQTLTTDLLDRISRMSLQLRPPMLDDLGLIPALTWQINRFQEETGIAVEFKHSGVEGVRFAPEIETTAYRVAQESLTNVARHARGTRVKIKAQRRGVEMDIQIEDNGVGFDPQAALALNRGLGGMRERVQLVGGAFELESEPGNGARKFIRLPWKERA